MFEDRFDAAEKLLPMLDKYKSDPNAIVLAIPRGGLELGYVLAKGLNLPLDVIFTKKIGYPGQPEYAIGAASEFHVFVEPEYKNKIELQDYINKQVTLIREVIKERNLKYRKNLPPFNIENKTVIVVDDGVATGSTMLVTLELLKKFKPKKIVIALPVASSEAIKKIKLACDEVICYAVPEIFYGVGQFYRNFDQVEDEDAIKLLHEANL
jgi:putative phosphoribosyl transferase